MNVIAYFGAATKDRRFFLTNDEEENDFRRRFQRRISTPESLEEWKNERLAYAKTLFLSRLGSLYSTGWRWDCVKKLGSEMEKWENK